MINGLILAAGRGRRMKGATEYQPKCFALLAGKKLIEWQLKAFKGASIKEVAIVTGYKKEMVANFTNLSFFNENWEETNMIWSLLCASDFISKAPCIISYSDIAYTSSTLLLLVKEVQANISITSLKDWQKLWEKRFLNPLEDVETFKISEEGFIKEIGKKPVSFDQIEGQYMGLLRINPQGWKELKECIAGLPVETIKHLDMTSLLSLYVQQGGRVKVIQSEGPWYEVDTEEDLNYYHSINHLGL